MQYRKFGKLDWDVSVLGFGCMRFPTIDGKAEQIDEPLAAQMLHTAIESGVNYIDTAYPYHRKESEPFVGRVLKNGYRDKVRLATKMPSWLLKTPEDLDRYLNKQLERLQTESIDFYLLHALNQKSWDTYKKLKVFEWAESAKAYGRIHQLGFSFHDSYEVYADILGAYDWDFVQIQYNYMNLEHQAGMQGLKDAAARNIPVVIMEPLLGGSLAKEPPERIKQEFEAAPVKRTPADWALQWLWDQPEVTTVLSGMSAMEHVEENLLSANKAAAKSFTPEEHAVINNVRKIYEEIKPIDCTACEYCLPCTEELNIPGLFNMLNYAEMYDAYEGRRSWYKQMSEKTADMCSQCEDCVEKCPQMLDIPMLMEIVHAVLGEGEDFEGIPG